MQEPAKNNKVMPEKEYRKKLLERAKVMGCGEDLAHLLDKWDRAMALAPDSEKEDMAVMAILEIQRLMDIQAKEGLTINGKVIIPKTE